MRRALRVPKDAALGMALRSLVNSRLAEIGEVVGLSVDTATRQAWVRLALQGEASLVDLHVRRFALDRADGRDWLTLVDVAASRAWVEASLRRFAVGRPIPISVNAARILRLLA